MNNNTKIIVCSNFAEETWSVVKKLGLSNTEVKVFNSNCGRPPISIDNIDRLNIDKSNSENILIGSVCTKEIVETEISTNIIKLGNCFQLVLNKELVNHYISKGGYLVTPGWLRNWRNEIKIWGFDDKTAKQFFAESSNYILLLNTGVVNDIQNYLDEFSIFVGLPNKVLPVGTDHLEMIIQRSLNQVKKNHEKKDSKVSDYMMMMDLLNDLAESLNEGEVINKITSLFSILFAPSTIYFLPIYNGLPGNLISQPKTKNTSIIIEELLDNNEKSDDKDELTFKLIHKNELVGIIKLKGISFPQYIDHYQNLALSVIKVCSLVISNSRTHQLIISQRDELSSTLKNLKDTQEKLVESQKMAALGNLVAGIAHEINTPLSVGITASTGIINKVNNLEDLFFSGKLTKSSFENSLNEFRETSNLIYKNLERTSKLVQSFKKVSVDETSDRIREFDIISYINDIVVTLTPELTKKNINVIVTGSKSINTISYPGVYAQIITNLIINSITHAFKNINNPRITIDINKIDELLTLSYSDNGCGIPSSIIDKIFEPFFTTNKQEGSGLGLHITYNLVVQKLGGSIVCENKDGLLTIIKVPMKIKEHNIDNHSKMNLI